MNPSPTEDDKASMKDVAIKAIKLLGGPVEAQRKVQAPTYQSVQSWASNGVPPRYCIRVSELTGIRLDELRPNDWARYWIVPFTAKAKESSHA